MIGTVCVQSQGYTANSESIPGLTYDSMVLFRCDGQTMKVRGYIEIKIEMV